MDIPQGKSFTDRYIRHAIGGIETQTPVLAIQLCRQLLSCERNVVFVAPYPSSIRGSHMSVQVGLNLVTLVMCIITLAMATAALMPQIKAGLVLLRDLMLWGILVGVLVLVGFVGWKRLIELRREQQESTLASGDQMLNEFSEFEDSAIRAQLESLRSNSQGTTTKNTAPQIGAPQDLLRTYRFPDRAEPPIREKAAQPVFRANRSNVRRPAFRASAPR